MWNHAHLHLMKDVERTVPGCGLKGPGRRSQPAGPRVPEEFLVSDAVLFRPPGSIASSLLRPTCATEPMHLQNAAVVTETRGAADRSLRTTSFAQLLGFAERKVSAV